MEHYYDEFGANAANHVALSPISFLARAETLFGDRNAVIYGDLRQSWADTGLRCRRIAAGLARMGVTRGDTVAVLLPNLPEMMELHFAVPLAGAVLNAINIRLEADTIAYILDHGDAMIVMADTTLLPMLEHVFELLGRRLPVVEIRDPNADPHASALAAARELGTTDYKDLAASEAGQGPLELPSDEWQAIALNYTSGTSGRPKGVVYHHRGAYLIALGTAAGWQTPHHPVYLSVVPMFHCNGWGHPWLMAMLGATMVFTRSPDPALLIAAIRDHGVTHLGAAPIVLQMMAEADEAQGLVFDPAIEVLTAGAPPPPAVLQKARAMGLNVMQVYGLTETYGHITQCLWQDAWAALDPAAQAQQQAMQGIAFPMVEGVTVFDRDSGEEVPHDGETQGEIAIRGNVVMKGYYKDARATDESFRDGWFWSGDAAVVHPDGYIQIRDRLKDVIISGGENISSVEVEAALYHHPAVQAAAVVAQPDPKWGEVPCAFVELRGGAEVSADEIIAFCRGHLAGFKTPKHVVFGELPKTATGKIQKFQLRERARQAGAIYEG